MVVLVRGTSVEFLVCVVRGLVDGRREVEIRAMSGRDSRWRDGSTHHGCAWRGEWARRCEVCGIAFLEEAIEALLHLLNSALLGSFVRSAIPLDLFHMIAAIPLENCSDAAWIARIPSDSW